MGSSIAQLLERDAEMAAILAVLSRAGTGSGGQLFLRGPAGVGKTTLLRAAREDAVARGQLVLSARGSDFEQDFPFGTARRLFEPVVGAMGPEQAERLFAASASLCRPMFGSSTTAGWPSEDQSAAFVEGLAWFVAHLAEAHPHGVLLCVDDVQVCDRATLRALARLTLGLDAVGVAVVLAQRLGSRGRNDDLLDWLATDDRTSVLDLGPLSAEAIATLVETRLGAGMTGIADAVCEVTGGNPFLTEQLLTALHEEGLSDAGPATIRRVRGLVPTAVLHAVTTRVRRLGEDARRLSRAVAVLGDDARLADAAALAGLIPEDAAREAARLAEEGLFSLGDQLAFRHPLVASAVRRDLSAVERGALHGRAAEVLRARGGPDERIAAHLLATPPGGDPEAVAVLRRAAAANVQGGGAEGAVPLLRRALDEPPADADRPSVVLELARAEAAAGDPTAKDRLLSALELVDDPHQRIVAMRDLTRLQFMNEHHAEAAATARQARSEVPADDPLAPDLLAEYLATGGFGSGTIDPVIRGEIQDLAMKLIGRHAEGTLPDSPALCIQVANMLSGSRGRSADVRRLVEAALEHGPLSEVAPFGLAPIWATLALTASDALDLAGTVAAEGYATAQRSGTLHQLGTAAFSVAIVSVERGDLERAEGECARALELTQSGVPATLPWSAGILATTRRLRGDLGGARRAIEIGARTGRASYTHGIVLFHRSLLALAEGDPHGCLEDALTARDLMAEFGIGDYALTAWRVPAAAAAHRLGRHEQATAWADEEVELARRAEAAKPLGVALMARAGIEPDPACRLSLMEEAAAALAATEARLARAQCSYRLAKALEQAGSEAVGEHLMTAYRLAAACDARPLVATVRGELTGRGIRPGPWDRGSELALLTEAERRVADLAADGRSNREIAAVLHLSVSTVEFHLTRSYRKLGIRSRAELVELMGS